MANPPLLTNYNKLIGLVVLGLFLFAANLVVLWNFSGIRHKVKIENGSTAPVFQVVVMESGKPELFLLPAPPNSSLQVNMTRTKH
jgi:hypothetical protein